MNLFTVTVRIKNTKTGEVGLLIKHCKKTVKVLTLHPTIKNAHAVKYWRDIESI